MTYQKHDYSSPIIYVSHAGKLGKYYYYYYHLFYPLDILLYGSMNLRPWLRHWRSSDDFVDRNYIKNRDIDHSCILVNKKYSFRYLDCYTREVTCTTRLFEGQLQNQHCHLQANSDSCPFKFRIL